MGIAKNQSAPVCGDISTTKRGISVRTSDCRDYPPRGLTHVSDNARHALVDWRSPRISLHTASDAKRPFISICADLAGKNVLKTPMGRLPLPGAIVSTNGSRQSYHVSTMCSVCETTVSVAVERGSPAREKLAPKTGSAVFAKAG